MSRRPRTIPRCEFEFEVGLGGVDGLPGDDHTEHCSTPATHVLHVYDEVEAQVMGDGHTSWVLCDAHRDLLLTDAAVSPFGITVLSEDRIPEEA